MLWIPYRRIDLEPRLRHPRRLPGPSQHRERVREVGVRPLQAEVVADLLGEPHGVTEVADAFVAAAEVGEVAARAP